MSLFRLGIITDEVSQNPAVAIRIAQQYGLEALEFRSVDNQPFHKLSDNRIAEIAAMVHEAGLVICGLSTPVFKCRLDAAQEIEEHLGILKRSLDIAKQLKVKRIRGFSFWADGEFDLKLPLIVEQLRRIEPLLQKAEVVYALEFDPSLYACNARKVRRVLDAVNSPWIRGLYDPGNDLWDPDCEVPYPDGYNELHGTIDHIHLKDAVKTEDGVHGVAIGQGEVDYKGLLERLIEDQYSGFLVVETHYRLHSPLTEEQLKRPAGSDFSAGGEEASRECLDSLFVLLQELELLNGTARS